LERKLRFWQISNGKQTIKMLANVNGKNKNPALYKEAKQDRNK